MQAADQLKQEHGLTFDVIDLRSIFPYDWKTISHSVLKTGRVLIVNEDTEVTNFGEHLLRRVIEEHFYDLLVRPRVLLGKHIPGHRPEPGLRAEQRAASWRTSRRPCTRLPRNRHRCLAASVDVYEVRTMDFKLPELGEGVYEAELTAWLVKPGDEVKRGQSLMEVMTDKASMEVPAPFAGTITDLRAEPGQQIKVGDLILTYEGDAAAGDGATRTESVAALSNGGEKHLAAAPPRRRISAFPESVRAAPSVRLMARKLGVDLIARPRQRPRGTHPPGRPRRRRSRRANGGETGRAQTRLRQAGHAGQAPGLAAPDCRAHGPCQAVHSELRLCR